MKKLLLSIWNSPDRAATWIITAAAVLGALYGVPKFVDCRVEAKLKDPVVLRELAMRIRPSVIFDAEDRILSDLGGLNYIDSIHVERTSNMVPSRVIVTPKHFLAQAPLLTSLDPVAMSGAEQPARGPGITWVYNIGVLNLMADVPRLRFRLEVIP